MIMKFDADTNNLLLNSCFPESVAKFTDFSSVLPPTKIWTISKLFSVSNSWNCFPKWKRVKLILFVNKKRGGFQFLPGVEYCVPVVLRVSICNCSTGRTCVDNWDSQQHRHYSPCSNDNFRDNPIHRKSHRNRLVCHTWMRNLCICRLNSGMNLFDIRSGIINLLKQMIIIEWFNSMELIYYSPR